MADAADSLSLSLSLRRTECGFGRFIQGEGEGDGGERFRGGRREVSVRRGGESGEVHAIKVRKDWSNVTSSSISANHLGVLCPGNNSTCVILPLASYSSSSSSSSPCSLANGVGGFGRGTGNGRSTEKGAGCLPLGDASRTVAPPNCTLGGWGYTTLWSGLLLSA